MKMLLAATGILALSACALPGDIMPPDADVWRNAGTGSGPHGGELGSPMPKAVSPAAHFADGGSPYNGLCGRRVTSAATACTVGELKSAGLPVFAARLLEVQ